MFHISLEESCPLTEQLIYRPRLFHHYCFPIPEKPDDAEINLCSRVIARPDWQGFCRHRWQRRRVRDPKLFCLPVHPAACLLTTEYFVRNSGKATVAGLASRGARVYMGARSADRASEAITDIRQSLAKPEADILFLPLDLQDFASILEATQLIKSFVTYFLPRPA